MPEIASTFSGSAQTPSAEKMCLTNFNSLSLNSHFSLFNFRLASLHFSNTCWRCSSCSAGVDPHTIMSSWILATPSRPWMIFSNMLMPNISLAFHTPNGKQLKRYLLNGVLKVSRSALSSFTRICHYPELASNLENILAPGIFAIISSTVGSWKCSLLIALFRFLGSKQSLNLPFDFSTTTMLLTQSVGWVTFSITFRLYILSNSIFIFFCNENGMHRGGSMTGSTDGSILILYSPGRQTNVPKCVRKFL